MLLRQEKLLIRHLDKFKDTVSKLFEDRNAFYDLKETFRNMLDDNVLQRAYIVIDALDECRDGEPGISQLLDLISELSETNDKVKWLVSSRSIPHIESHLEEHGTRTRLSLELNSDSVASAVEVYKQKYPATRYANIQEKLEELQVNLAKELREKTAGTFLWVALVFKQIEGCGADKVLEHIRNMPPGLDAMYAQMIRHMEELEEAEDCASVVLRLVNAFRPLHSSELVVLAGLSDLASHEEIVKKCGFLTIREDNDMVYFVHQSAKDFLVKPEKSNILLVPGPVRTLATLRFFAYAKSNSYP